MSKNPAAHRIAIASRRLLNSGGVDAVTMRRVANAVGLTPMAIYRHYYDRAALLNAVADEGFKELALRLARTPKTGSIEDRLVRMAEVFLGHALDNPRLFELMFLEPRAGARRYPEDFEAGQSPTANFLAQVVHEGMEGGYFRRVSAWEIVFDMGALSHGLIMLYLGGRMKMSPGRFRSLYRRSFRRYIHGICK
jgi:AcrR family transcriptional regulator